ncbi:MAG: hypothetical protein JNL74_16915 [Fibrobacteres bacterium]|nr:hypothetical protein [Fibrobacterota bacterium]
MIKLIMSAFVLIVGSVYGIEPPSSFNGLKFGSDSAKVYKVFPASENQKHKVLRRTSGVSGVAQYTLVYPKGVVDSASLYFVGNRFAMAVEYWYPGADFMEKATQTLSAKYGTLVRSAASSYIRRDGDYCVRLTWSESDKRAVVSYFSVPLSAKLQEKVSASIPDEGKIIDSTITALEKELKKLDSEASTK